jgi:hypothetical protein
MKIEIEIPDWAASTRLLIIAGTECVAQKLPQDDFWQVKKIRCNRCGECCLDSPPTPYGLDDEGKCVKLIREGEEWICTAGMGKALRCVLDPNIVGYEACCITHKKVMDK